MTKDSKGSALIYVPRGGSWSKLVYESDKVDSLKKGKGSDELTYHPYVPDYPH